MKTAVGSAKNSAFALIFADFKEITKARLAISVVFSSLAGYFLGAYEIQWGQVLLLAFGGYCMVGASNAYNQVIEKDLDALMKRTKNRPIPAGRMSVNIAMAVAIVLTLLGVLSLYLLNPKTAMFGAISIFLYTSVYTPLKTITPLAVFVGAIPGAIPFMLGWVAATNDFGIEPGTLFMIQFFWQFPHFWALGWMLDDDYKKAGFNMLPTGNRDKKTAFQIILYVIWMIIISVFPYTGLTGDLSLGIYGAIIVLVFGFMMLIFAFNLYNRMDINSARKLFFFTILYLTAIQLVYIFDKFL